MKLTDIPLPTRVKSSRGQHQNNLLYILGKSLTNFNFWVNDVMNI